MLADAAIIAQGKLYIHGGGWDMIYAPPGDPNEPIQHDLAFVMLVQTEWHEAQTDLRVAISLLDADGSTLIRGEGTFRTGHSPDAQPGDPATTAHVSEFRPLSVPKAGLYTFRVDDAEGTPLAEVPFRVSRREG